MKWKLFLTLVVGIYFLSFASGEYKYNILATGTSKINCLDITGGSDPDFCVDATGNGTGATWLELGNGTMVAYSTLNNGTYPTWNTITNNTFKLQTNITFTGLNSTADVFSWFNRNLSMPFTMVTNNTFALLNTTWVSWLGVSNGTIAVTNLANVFGNFNQTFNVSTLFIDSVNARVGMRTTVPLNVLNVVGDINATTTIWSMFNKNLTIPYDLTTNNTFAQLIVLNNGTYITQLVLNNGTYVIASVLNNGTYATWLALGNGTIAKSSELNNGTYTLMTNTSYLLDSGDTATGNYTFDSPTFHIDSTRNRIGIGLTNPSAKLHVNATDNTTTPFKVQGLNASGLSATWFVINATNGSVGIGTSTPSSPLHLIGTLTLGNTANSNTGTIQFDSSDRILINRPIQFGTATAPQIRATATIIINAEGDAQNIELRTATNGDILFTTNTSIERARIKSVNGYFGINTTTPQNTLNVLGDINGTGSIFSFNKNLTIGYDLATNNTFAQLTTLNNGSYFNVAGGSYPYTNVTQANVTSTVITVYNATVFLIPLTTNTNYSIGCVLHTFTSVSTVGVWLNTSYSGTSRIYRGEWNSPTTAIAPLYKTCTNTNCTTNPTAGVVEGLPVYFDGYIETTGAGSFNLSMRAEAAGTVTMGQGSLCTFTNTNLGAT